MNEQKMSVPNNNRASSNHGLEKWQVGLYREAGWARHEAQTIFGKLSPQQQLSTMLRPVISNGIDSTLFYRSLVEISVYCLGDIMMSNCSGRRNFDSEFSWRNQVWIDNCITYQFPQHFITSGARGRQLLLEFAAKFQLSDGMHGSISQDLLERYIKAREKMVILGTVFEPSREIHTLSDIGPLCQPLTKEHFPEEILASLHSDGITHVVDIACRSRYCVNVLPKHIRRIETILKQHGLGFACIFSEHIENQVKNVLGRSLGIGEAALESLRALEDYRRDDWKYRVMRRRRDWLRLMRTQ